MGISPKEEKFINNLQQEIIEYLELNDDRSFSVNQLHKAFAIRDRKTKEIYSDVVSRLVREGRLQKQADGNVRVDTDSFMVEGRVDHVNARFAFIVRDDAEKDIWVSTQDLYDAKDGDRVRVQARKSSNKKQDRPEGEVVEILDDGRESLR
jgi:ribonuclease R